MLRAGKLRHRLVIQKPVYSQNQTTGDMVKTWGNVATVWAAIEPLSVKEFVTSSVEESKVSARVTIRYRDDISYEMRLYHQSKDKYYNIEGLLSDKDSGLEYLSIPVSEGVRYQEGSEVLPVVLTTPVVGGTAQVGDVVESSTGEWANDPTSYTYQWYRQGAVLIESATNDTYLLTEDEEGLNVYCTVTAVNSAGSVSSSSNEFGPVLSA